jgi:hypothetical protein
MGEMIFSMKSNEKIFFEKAFIFFENVAKTCFCLESKSKHSIVNFAKNLSYAF